MKKLLSLLAFVGMISLVACGPSKEEQEKAEKMKQDSIAAAQATADSLAKAEAAAKATADSLAAAQAAEQAKADSLAAAAAKAQAKPKAKTPVQKKDEEAKKATRGRG